MTGRCPKCKSSFYTPDPGNGGAGRNICMECKHTGPVATFYPEPSAPANFLMATGSANPIPLGPNERRFAVFEPGQRLNTDTPPAPIRQYKDE